MPTTQAQTDERLRIAHEALAAIAADRQAVDDLAARHDWSASHLHSALEQAAFLAAGLRDDSR